MSDYEEAERGVLKLENISAKEMLQQVASMFEESPDEAVYIDISFKDRWEQGQIMRMYMVEDNDDQAVH